MEWDTVIGLEIHVQLATKTKLFSGSATAFGADPNTQASAVDLAMPGTLPVPNEQAFRYAVMFGLAVNAEINQRSVFERKNYFYPDLPKGYQTTQLAEPIVGAGKIDVALPDGSIKTVRIHHAHLEEDAGKSLHQASSQMESHGYSGIDLNRAGTPLIEIVTEPDMTSAVEAVAFAKELHSIVTSLGICDGDMSQGSMRFDVNISIKPKGSEKLGTRTETKNLNSFRFMEEAIAMEVDRQIDVLESGGKIVQETRLYNGDTKKSRSMRSKEDSNDYRYFPCPDLLPVILDDDYIQKIRNAMPELPAEKASRFSKDYGLSDYDAHSLAVNGATSEYFEAAAKASGQPKLVANWIMGELAARLNQNDLTIQQSPLSAEQLAGIIEQTANGTISSKIAKQVFDALWNGEGASAVEIIEARGWKQVSDTGELEKIIDEIVANNPQQVENYRKAEGPKQQKMLGFFVGQIMKATKGQANPQAVNDILLAKLKA